MAIVTTQEKKLNNLWCWLYIILCIAPLIFWEEFQVALSSDKTLIASLLFYLLVTVPFIILDKRALSAAGFSAPHPLWVFFVPPVYYYKRANITGARRKYMFWVITLISVALCLILLLASISYAIITFYVEHKVCEFLDTRTEQKYGQEGLDTHACEAVVFNVMDYLGDESNGPFNTEVRLRSGKTIEMDVQITEDGNVNVISPYPW